MGYVFIMVLVRVSKGKEGYLDIKFMVLFCVRGRLDSWGLEDGYLYTFLQRIYLIARKWIGATSRIDG